ncbi:caspase family protein [Streptomyces cinerochromogenes]|uniref:HD domain-containing protein n=1 Tax=Streptomyces cinerochromogenes TaxID=66422 RepID=UPI00369897D2
MSGGRRRALLIGVSAYPQLDAPNLREDFPNLPFARNDVATLRTALLNSGYLPDHVTVLDDEEETSAGTIYDELGRFLNACEDGDVGLVYFSGHGVRFGDTDYLLPGDVRARWGADEQRTLRPQGLIEIVPDELLAPLRSNATVMLCFDACRSSGDTPPATFEAIKISRAWDNVVVLSACAPGEEALGHADDGSVLARALSETLLPTSSARTFRQVIERVEQRAEEIAANYRYSRPPRAVHRWLGGDATGGAHADVALCNADPSGGPWTDAVLRSNLWERTDGTPGQRTTAKEHLADVVKKTVAIRRRRNPESDPWDDEQVPQRLIERLDQLVDASGARLSLIETVVLLGAPFLREAALSCGLAALRTALDDHGLDGTPPDEDGFAAHLERDMGDVRRAHRQIEATRRTLLRREEKEDAAGAEYWLRHRFLADWDLLWEQGRTDAELDSLRAAVDLLVRAAESAAGLTLGPDERAELRHAVVKVVSQLGTGTPADSVAPDGTSWDTEPGLCAYLCGEPERWSWRPRELATLLHLAGLLALDPRMLDGVLIDHLGPREPTQVRPKGIIGEIAANSGFLPVEAPAPEAPDGTEPAGLPGRAPGSSWRLVFKCSSAALFTALERLAARIAAESEATRRGLGTLRSGDLLFGLPQMVKTEGLLPRNHGFDKPPPRFRLAEDEVKPLIMGTQLYGDRMLAVRELYQNALDACRVRQARRRYADRVRQTPGQTEPEQLADCTIRFTQGTEAGRTYIECEDDGVGMTAEELRDLFAQAGRRSEQSSARMREMRRWRRRGITTELNSRFGIGVFSYFMLAEEVEVTTRAVGVNGHRILDGHRATVTAGSGLMHLNREQRELPNGGTRVRLYLHDDSETDEQPPSLIQALREFLWYSPVKVIARENRGDPAEWQPGELYGDSSLPGARIPAGEGVWWVQGKGMLLADGLLVSDAERPEGYVVNLRGRHRPELSVDRNRFLRYDEQRVEEDLKEAVPALVGSAWRPFPLEWLWNLADAWPRLAEEVLGHLMDHDVPVSVPDDLRGGDWAYEPRRVTLRTAGCLPVDDQVLKDDARQVLLDAGFFGAWRISALGVKHHQETVVPHEGFPRPEPLDAVLFRHMPDESIREPLRAAADTGRPLREVVRLLRRYALTGVPVPEVADVRALTGFVPKRLATVLYQDIQDATGPGAPYERDAVDQSVRQAMVRVSGHEKVTLGALAELLGQLSALDPSIPAAPDLKGLAAHRVDARERRVLLNDVLTRERYAIAATHSAWPFDGLVRPVDVAYRAAQTGIPPAEIEAVVRRFEPLGYRLAGPDLPALLDDPQLTALSRDLDAQPPFLTPEPIGLRHLVRLAARRRQTVGATAGWLAGWAGALGVEVADPGPLASFLPPAWCERLPTQQPDESRTGDGGGTGPRPVFAWTVLAVIEDLGDDSSGDQHIATVTALADAGVVEPRTLDAVRTLLSVPRSARGLWSRGLTVNGSRRSVFNVSANVGLYGRLEPSAVLYMAVDLHDSLGDAAERLRSQTAAYDFHVPEVPADVADLQPSHAVRQALCATPGSWEAFVSLRDLVLYANSTGTDLATAAADLNAYRSLGAPTVPVPPGFVRPEEPLERDEAAEYALFQPGLEDSWTLTPLALVVAAGRLGGGLRETYRRLEPFTRIGLDVPFAEPDCDRVPDWRDVVLLTARLTGREPALSGDVTADQLRLAAEETDLTEDDVRVRLADYAPLFGFRIPPHERT